MRLLVDCHVFDGKYQGTRTYIQGIYSELIKQSEIDFYFAAQNVKTLKEAFGTSKNVHFVQLCSKGKINRLLFEYPRIIKKYKIDYAHFQYITPFRKCCKEIVTIHDLLFLDYPHFFPILYRIKNHLLFYRSARRADLLLTVSEYSKKSIARHFSIDSQKIVVTPNAVLSSVGLEKTTGICQKYELNRFLLSVGRIEPRKNFLSLLQAFVELKLNQQGYKLVFVGIPDLAYKEFYKYYDLLEDPVKQAIVFLNATFCELVELYRKTNLFVFPSYAEGFGIPPLEAIEYGSPTLCSKETAMAEFGLPEEMLFDPYDKEELKRKILRSLKSRNDLCCRKIINERFNWCKSSRVLYDALSEYKNVAGS